jgi:hypothetical protein
MPTVKMIMVIGASVLTVMSVMGMVPLWPAVGCLCVWGIVSVFPMG